MIVLLLVAFALIALADVPHLIKEKDWRELAIYSVFFVAAFIPSLLQTLGTPIPSAIAGIQYLIKDILHLNYQ